MFDSIDTNISTIERYKNRIPADFDWQAYLKMNSDLGENGINDEITATCHYVLYGYKENRTYHDQNIELVQIHEFNKTLPKMTGVAIVTPDAIGPVKNGGIGTTCFHFALSLAKYNTPVTLVYSGYNIHSLDEYSHYRQYYAQFNIDFIYIPTIIKDTPIYNTNKASLSSIAVCEYLHTHNFNYLIFQDWFGNGFWPIREKKLGRKFIDTHISIMCQSCTEWQNDGMHIMPHDIYNNTMTRWLEKESIIHADSVICTSKHMKEWLKKHGYYNRNTFIVRPSYHDTQNLSHQGYKALRNDHFCFFGRLEKRKGLDIFIDALKLLPLSTLKDVKQITFLGKHATVDQVSSEIYIDQFINYVKQHNLDIKINVENDKDHYEAIKYILNNQCIVVAPSILDNAPMVVIESLFYRIPIIGSNSSGIKELLEPNNLFQPNAASLSHKIKQILHKQYYPKQKKYPGDTYGKKWRKFVHDITIKTENNTATIKQNSTIDVVIPYYNHGKYIVSLITRLLAQTHPVDNIYIINDGSTNIQDFVAVNSLKNRYSNVHVIHKHNSGPGHTRNMATSLCNSDYIIFFDADNMPHNNFVEQMYNAINYSQSDVVFAAFEIFDENKNNLGAYVPLGTYIDWAYKQNTLGDSCCILKKQVIRSCPFPEERNVHEDWIWAIKLLVNSYSVSSIYSPVFNYTKYTTGRSASINHNLYNHYQLIINELSAISNPNIKNLFLRQLILSTINT